MSRGGAPSKRSVATGGKPREAIVAGVLAQLGEIGQMQVISIRHDDGCPTLVSQCAGDCTCEILDVGEPEPFNDFDEYKAILERHRSA